VASPILRDTIKKLKDRQALLRKQVKGPLAELAQIEEDLRALGAAAAPRTKRAAGSAPAPRGARQAAILRAIRNGATTPQEIAERTSIAVPAVTRAVSGYADKQRLVVTGPTGLALTKAGRDRLRELEGR
jgi:DNA-binding NarL/FixJ family response regulator